MLAAHVRDAEIALVLAVLRAYRGEQDKKSNDGNKKMNSRGIFGAYTGMLNVASRREDHRPTGAASRKRRFGMRLRFF